MQAMGGTGSLVLRTAAWCAGVLLAGAGLLTALVVGVGALVGPGEAHSDDRPDTALQEFTRLAADDPGAALRACTPARGTDFDALAGTLPAGAVVAEQRFAVVDGELLFLSAPVAGDELAERDGDRAVWVYGRHGFAAVTDDARALSPDLSGPALYGVDTETSGVVRVATCVEAALRASESGVAAEQGPAVPAGVAGGAGR
ncbi:hypothetical protein C8E95_6259 [Pseudonocardia autotrophica]|uniref:Uncharacterized protein n=1 Tax=Pseudonocardia autotrophica TaxID=2074 RepID=A0A1Y2MTK0_PSEAH|nr:hypothetical protein BG845_04038 [Pseudonocardia autotrophica]TDN77035.1 hypothetical protein C8E95_6259 [Pseudonocardia autotrophica]